VGYILKRERDSNRESHMSVPNFLLWPDDHLIGSSGLVDVSIRLLSEFLAIRNGYPPTTKSF